MEQRSAEKSRLIYDVIDNSGGFYECPAPVAVRSRVNVTFRIGNSNAELEKQFVDQAKQLGMIQLKGHRSVGGIRASLYNAVSVPDAGLLAAFMKTFMSQHQP